MDTSGSSRTGASRLGWLVATGIAVVLGGMQYLQLQRLGALQAEVAGLRASRADIPPRPALPDAPAAPQPAPSLDARQQEEFARRVLVDQIAFRTVELLQPYLKAPPAEPSANRPRVQEHEPVAELDEAKRAALAKAHEKVDALLARGRMTKDEVLELRGLLATVGNRRETDDLRARLGTALNQGRLIPPNEPFFMMP
jgi:hypothetical protein